MEVKVFGVVEPVKWVMGLLMWLPRPGFRSS